jgi:transcriptional regulator GlxA family with amidase domain
VLRARHLLPQGEKDSRPLETLPMRQLALTASVVAIAVLLAEPGPALAAPISAPVAASADHLVLPAPKTGRSRPLVVVVGDDAGAETTDFIIPYAVLKESGLADVRTLSTAPGPLKLMMTLKVQPDETTAQFQAAEPRGADIVIVPAQMNPKDAELIAFIRDQAAKGATIVSICEGARVLAEAGLLDGRRATTHFASLAKFDKAYPRTTWVRDRRYVQDGPIISTTGVTASIPASLALVEAIGGRAEALATARRIGVSNWGSAHRTADFAITGADYASAISGMAAVWTHETLEVPLADGADEIALALRADAWGRTFRSKVVSTRAGLTPTRGHNGLMILPEAEPVKGRPLIPVRAGPPALQLESSLVDIGLRYGPGAARLARVGLEYDPPARQAAQR